MQVQGDLFLWKDIDRCLSGKHKAGADPWKYLCVSWKYSKSQKPLHTEHIRLDLYALFLFIITLIVSVALFSVSYYWLSVS